VLTVVWAALAGAALLLTDPVAPDVARPLSAPVLLVLLVATQAFVVNVQLRREARSVFISEMPVFLALMSLPPLEVVLLRAVAAVIGFGVVRRQYRQPRKLVFNTFLAAAEGGVAVVVLQLVAGSHPSTPVLWLGGLLGASAASGFSALGVALMIELLEGRPRAGELVRLALRTAVVSSPIAAMGCVVWAAWDDDPWSALPLAAVAGVVLWGYRGFAVLREQHLALERLHRFNQVVSRAPELDDVLSTVLQQAREVLHAEQARLTFVPDTGVAQGFELLLGEHGLTRGAVPLLDDTDWLVRRVLRRQEPVLVRRGTRDPAERRWLEGHGLRDAVLTPLLGAAGTVAVLAVENRLGDVRGFGRQEVPLLETVAHQAAVTLRNGELVAQLRHESLHDPLTGLPNRTQFHREVEARLHRDGSGFCVGILDLDSFKEVNDTLGHHEGDRLLSEVAARLSSALPEDGVVARLGGDEFAVLLPHCDDAVAAARAGTLLLQVLEAPVSLAGIAVDVTGSLGLVLSPQHGQTAGLLLQRADQAMYDAKHQGRQVRVFDVELDTASPSKLALVAELRTAIEAGDVVVHLQPKVSAGTGRVTGAEALARWATPGRGAVSPLDFVPLAERSGLIRPLTELALEQAVAACAGWQPANPGVGVAVNISVRSLSDPALVRLVNRVLRQHGLAPELLTLEITESHIMADPAGSLEVLERLRQRGVRLSVDDFGTGYSSLSYLRRLPVDEVKIDRSFVQGMVAQADDAAVVRSIVELARALGLHVVAEGVEDAPSWDALAALGVDEIQGFVVSEAVPVPAFVAGLPAAARA
jgi:diguanylate cyclase (GGDEF)-like protein